MHSKKNYLNVKMDRGSPLRSSLPESLTTRYTTCQALGSEALVRQLSKSKGDLTILSSEQFARRHTKSLQLSITIPV